MSRDVLAVLSGIGIIIVIGLLITHSSGTSSVVSSTGSVLNDTIRTLQFQQATTSGHGGA